MDVRNSFLFSFLRHIFGAIIFVAIGGCGGGGDEEYDSGSGATPSLPTYSKVSGVVSAPNAALAFKVEPSAFKRLAEFFTSSAHADLASTSSVPDGTLIELLRIDDDGNVVRVLDSTTTLHGKYNFDLSGVHLASDLIVRAMNESTGVQLRAFVTDESVDIDPVSEVVVRWVVDGSYGLEEYRLENFTINELRRIVAAIALAARIDAIVDLYDIETAVTSLQNELPHELKDALLFGAFGSGEREFGPGDIGNYFPTDQGITWTYDGTTLKNDGVDENFTRTVTALGPTNTFRDGTPTFQVTDSRRADSSEYSLDKYYSQVHVTESYWDREWNQRVMFSYIIAPLPPVIGQSVIQYRDGIIDHYDIDGDGQSDRAIANSNITPIEFQTISVPAGTFPNTIRLQTNAVLQFTLSSTGQPATMTTRSDEWYAPGIGLVKKKTRLEKNLAASTTSEVSTEQLNSITGLEVPIPGLMKVISVPTNYAVYDKNKAKIFASVSGDRNPRGDSILIINSGSGQIEAWMPAGADPGRMKISQDGSKLYVLMEDETRIGVYDLATRILELEIALGMDSRGVQLRVADIEVSPDNAATIAVAMYSRGWSPSFRRVAIFDRGVQRPAVFDDTFYGPFAGPEIIEFADSGETIYGFDREDFFTLRVDQNGVHLSGTPQELREVYSRDFKFDAGLIYGTSGDVIDPATGTRSRSFRVSNRGLVEPDSKAKRVYFVDRYDETLKAYDINSFRKMGSFALPEPEYDDTNTPHSLIRVGSDQIMVGTDDTLYLINTSLIN